MEYIFWVIFGTVLIIMVYRVIIKGGLKGAVFGSRIKNTIGEISLSKNMASSRVLRIHKLENGKVAFELSSKAVLAFSMTGFTVNEKQVEQLIEYLNKTKNISG